MPSLWSPSNWPQRLAELQAPTGELKEAPLRRDVRSLSDLAALTDLLGVRLPGQTHFWIIYPKRAGRYKVDFNENHVREAGLTAGFVDYKVCSIDNVWSALKFSWRKR